MPAPHEGIPMIRRTRAAVLPAHGTPSVAAIRSPVYTDACE